MPRDTTFSLASAERYLTKWVESKGEDHADLEVALYVMHVLAGTVRTRERFANRLRRNKVAEWLSAPTSSAERGTGCRA